jgi:predicted ATPase
MIKKIEVENFKSILAGELEIGYLNLLTGVNGSGKSTFLQTLLLIRQSYNAGSLFRKPVSFVLGDSDQNIF